MKPAVFEFYTGGTASKIWWRAVFSEHGLRGLALLRKPFRAARVSKRLIAPLRSRLGNNKDRRLCALKAKLNSRLAGKRAEMKWRELDLRGQPAFYVRVWRAMRAIPFGRVASYGQVAAAAGSPLAVRACGQACGANPILLFIPCHRVVAAHGLGGFGCGLAWKKYFLTTENNHHKGTKTQRKNIL